MLPLNVQCVQSLRSREFLPSATKLRQGNIFTSVCQEFCPWGGSASVHVGRHLPPQADGYCSGWYASYWNTYLYYVCCHSDWSFAEKTFVKQSMMLCAFEILLKIGRWGEGGKSSVRFTPPKLSSPIWSHGTLYLTSSVKGILGKISISESAFEERGRFFQFHHITFDYLLSTTI